MKRIAVGFVAVVIACGGSAVIDGSSDGGGGSTSTSMGTSMGGSMSSSMGPSMTTTGSSMLTCAELTSDMLEALELAMACDTCDDGPETCVYLSGVQLTDVCGCPVPVNSAVPEATAEAVSIYEEWVDQGCGPMACGQPCAISSAPSCTSNGTGCAGTCAP